MERCIVANSILKVKEEAYKEVCGKLKSQGTSPKLIVFFSAQDDIWYYAQCLYKDFPEAISIGTTTYVNFSSEGCSKNGITAMAVYSGIECSTGQLYEVNRHPARYHMHIRNALKQLSSTENTCCLSFTTAFGHGEELVQDTFYQELGDTIPVIGGSSGGNVMDASKTVVAMNGNLYANTCVFVFIHNLQGKIYLTKENIFKPTDKEYRVTDVDCDDYVVYEYDGIPAKYAMENALGVQYEENPQLFNEHPMGRITNNDIHITELNKINPDGSITYFSRIYNFTKMVVLEKDDFDTVWEKTHKQVKENIENPSFTICINCHSRTIMFEKDGRLKDFVAVLKKNYGKYIGVATFGEQLNFANLNQTMLLAVFE